MSYLGKKIKRTFHKVKHAAYAIPHLISNIRRGAKYLWHNPRFVWNTIYNAPEKSYKWFTATRRRKILSSILALLILLTSIRFALFQPKEILAWFNDNWQYRKKIVITNSGSQQTNYPVDIALGSLGGHQIRSDCADIRVTDVNSILTTNPYWVDCTVSTSPTVWVKFATLPVGSTVVYIYYGNPQVNDLSSNIDNVVTYGHDFTGTTINAAKVTQGGGLSSQNDYFILLNDSAAWDTYVYAASSQARAADLTFQAKFKADSGTNAMVGWHDNGSGASYTDLIYAVYFNNGTLDVFEDGNDRNCTSCTTYTAGSWYDVKIVLKATGAIYYYKAVTTDTWTQIYDSAYSSETPLKPGVAHNNSSSYSYTDSWVVFTQASTLPTLSVGSEEYAPGPVAFYKFDEGYSASESLPITKNEQQINILDQEFRTPVGDSNVYPTDNSLGIIRWDGTKYSDAIVYFEAVLRSNVGSDNAHAVLYTTGGSAVSGADVYSTSTGFVRLRSGPISLSDGTDYTVRAYNNGGNGGRQAIVRSARLIIVQNNSGGITNSETQIELGNAENTTSSTASQLTDKKIYYYDATKFSPDPSVYFEASIRAPQPTIEQQINIIDQSFTSTPGSSTPVPTDNSLGLVLWDANKYPGSTVYFEAVLTNNVGSDPGHAALYTEAGAAVSGADVSMNSAGTYIRARSSAITLSDDTKYTVRAYASGGNGGRTATVKAARLIITQSDPTKITDTETQIELGNTQNNFSNTSYTTLTDHKIYYYDSTKFSGTVNTYFEASIHTDSGSDTVYAQLLECTSSTDCSTGSAVSGSEVNHTGDANWSLPTRASVTLTSGKYYAVQTKVSAGTSDIANAKIIIDQTAAGGITSLETVHQQINTLATDTNDGYTSQDFNNRFNPDLNEAQKSFSGGTFTYYFDATMKTSAGTGYAQAYDKTNSAAITNSEITTTNTSYARVVSGDITSNLPQYPNIPARNLDTQLKNSAASGNTTSVSSSRLIIQVTNLATSAPTAYADLYNLTDTVQVSNSEVSTSSNSWSLVRSSGITLATGKQYVIRLRSSASGVGIKIANAKIILDQTSGSGITKVETVQQLINFAVTDADTGYTDQDFLNQFNPDNYHTAQSAILFEATMKTSTGGGANDAFAILKNDTAGSTISGSEISTDQTSYTRVRTGSSIAANMPSSSANMDTQIKNEATATTTVSSSWIIIQNGRSYSAVTHDSTQNRLHGDTNGITWKSKADCHSENCLSFDGSNDYVKVYDDSKIDFAASSNFTITGWFKHIAQTSGTDVILAKHGTTGSDGGYKVYMESDGDISFGIDDDDTWEPDDIATSTAATYDDNSWHHFAAIKTGTTKLDLYLDGTLVNTDNSIAAIGTLANNDHVYIGIDGDGTSNPWQGLLDEIKFYPYARTQAEINTDYSLGSTPHGTEAALGIQNESPLSNGLVGYWKMDESDWTNDCTTTSVADSSGNGINAKSCPSSTGPDPGAGKFGNGGVFDGNNDYVQSPDNDLLDFETTTDFSITAWVTKNDTTSGKAFIMKGQEQGGSSDGGWYLSYISNKIYVDLSSDLWNSYCSIRGTTDIADGNFHHISVIIKRASSCTTNDILIFIDGKQETTSIVFSGINTNASFKNNDPLTIGAYWNLGSAASFWNGKIDSVRMYNRALSPAEVQNLYNWAPGPIAYYKFDEGTGTSSVYDSSGNSFTGSITGSMTSNDWVSGKFGNGLKFDGVDDRVDYDGTLPISDYPFTFSVWVKSQGTPGSEDVILSIGDKDVSNVNYNIWRNSSNIVGLRAYDGTNQQSTTGTTDLDDQLFHHISVVFNSATERLLYVDGVLEATGTTSVTYNTSVDGIRIGQRRRSVPPASGPFNGIIDDVKIYNYARTNAQVVEDMNAGHPAPGSPVGSALLQYRFDEGYGDTGNNTGNGGSINANLAGATSCPGAAACPSWSNDGKIGKALSFDGTADYASTSTTVNLTGSNKITVAFWLNWDAYANNDDLALESSINFNDNNGGILINPNSGPPSGGRFSFGLQQQDITLTARYRSESISRPSAGTWHQYAVVFDNSTATGDITIYVDGLVQPTTIDVSDKDQSGTFGNYTWYFMSRAGSSLFGAGKMDDFRIFTSELTADQIKQLYNQGKSAVFGATSTDSSGVGTWSDINAYCPPGQGSTCTAPVAEWKFDEFTGTSANDTSGNANTGTLTNGPAWRDSGKCKIGSCLDFDGGSGMTQDDYVDAGSGSTIGNIFDGGGTVSFWINPRSAGEGSGHIMNKSFSANTGWYMQTVSCDSTHVDFQLRTDVTTDSLFRVNCMLNINQWNHVTVVYDDDSTSNSPTFYLNGVQKTLDTANLPDSSYGTDVGDVLIIGNSSVSSGNTYDGLLDQIRFYNYSRTSSQIAWEYNQGGPVGWWKFDECANAVAYDSSGNGNNGTITPRTTDNIAAGTCSSGITTEMWNDGTTGKRNASLGFDDDDDNVDLGDDDIYSFGNGTADSPFTLSAWIYDQEVTSGSIFDKTNIQGNDEYRLSLESGGNDITFNLSETFGSLTVNAADVTTANAWNHIVATYDGSSSENGMNIYLNGRLLDVTRTEGGIYTAMSNTTTPLSIGARWNEAASPPTAVANVFGGKIDEVKIFNYELTAQQIRDVMNEGAVHFGP